MEFFKVLQERHSIRAFAERPVEPEKLRALLEAANRAPSAGNLQAYKIYVVTRPTTLKALMRAAFEQKFVAQAPVVLVFCADPKRSASSYGERGATLYSVQDATIACAYVQLAATALGLGSVWVGAFDEDAVRKALEIGRELVPVALLPVGYAAESPQITSRRTLDEFVEYVV
ncbi:MAG: nitroreductase family protein [Candidatus Bipolaricaulota bacterium]|nr:nitroreductase family protein [Candidatus Bipolaricaulota bacterium]